MIETLTDNDALPSFSPYRWAELALERFQKARLEPFSAGPSVDVVMASDEAFLPYTAVAIQSILDHYRSDRSLRIFLLTDASLDNEHRSRFAQLSSDSGFELVEVVTTASEYEGLQTTVGISPTTYFRLNMHNLLPRDVRRVVYLDSDVIVRRCISELYNLDMTGYSLAGCEDSISRHYVEKFGQHPQTKHVNGGVLVVDLDAWRRIRFSDLLEDFASAKQFVLTLGDQEILTGILGLSTCFASIDWNVHGSMFDPKWRSEESGKKNQIDRDALERAVHDPAIIHYTYNRKPWISQEHPRSADWFMVASRTPYRDGFSTTKVL